jgi:hypothetical protein
VMEGCSRISTPPRRRLPPMTQVFPSGSAAGATSRVRACSAASFKVRMTTPDPLGDGQPEARMVRYPVHAVGACVHSERVRCGADRPVHQRDGRARSAAGHAGAALAGTRGPQPVRRNRSGRCPHGEVDRTIWAPGFGPGSGPRPDPTTPEEAATGAV